MARVGVVVVAGLADDGQAEHVAVEGGRAVEVRADRGDVVQPGSRRRCGSPGPPAAGPVTRGTRCRRSWPGRRAAPEEAERVDETPAASSDDLGSPVRKKSGTTTTTAAAPASSAECERKPAKCSRIAISRPASDASAMPQASRAPRRGPSLTNPRTMSTIATSTQSSTSGKGDHGAFGASAIGARCERGVRVRMRGRPRRDRGGGGGRFPARLRLRRPMDAECYGAAAGGRGNGQPEESLSSHQPMSIPSSPRRGRTSHAAAALAELDAGHPLEAVAAGLEAHRLEAHAGAGGALAAAALLGADGGKAARELVAGALEVAEVEDPRTAARRALRGRGGGSVGVGAGRAISASESGRSSVATAHGAAPARRRVPRSPAAGAVRPGRGRRGRPSRRILRLGARPTEAHSASSTWTCGYARDAHGEDAQLRASGPRPVAVGDRAEEHRDRPPGVGDDEAPGGQVGARAALPPAARRSRAARTPSGPSSRSASSAQSGTPVSSAPTSSASSTRPRERKPPCMRRSTMTASTGGRSTSGSRPTWREKAR